MSHLSRSTHLLKTSSGHLTKAGTYKKCFQVWTASWSCSTLSWTGPTAGGGTCQLMDTGTSWTKTASDASGCTYQIYVPYDPEHCCTVDGDCSGLGNTSTPALPFSGGTPSDCTCPTVSNCTNCDFISSASPRTITVSFSGVTIAAATCDVLCAFGTFESSGTLGTYTLTQDPLDPCHWYWLGTGPSWTTYSIYNTGPPCTVGGDTATYNALRIDLHVNGTGSWKLTASTEGPGFESDPTGYLWFYSDSDPGPPDCCTAFDVTNVYTSYGCDNPGIGGTATITPTC